jgi:hypothetical protein
MMNFGRFTACCKKSSVRRSGIFNQCPLKIDPIIVASLQQFEEFLAKFNENISERVSKVEKSFGAFSDHVALCVAHLRFPERIVEPSLRMKVHFA